MFICGKWIQRLIFYNGQNWEEHEQKHIEDFRKYLKNNPKMVIDPE